MRWTGPFFLLLAFLTNAWLATRSEVYFYIFILHCSLFVLPLLDLIFRSAGVHIAVLRFRNAFLQYEPCFVCRFFQIFKKN
jgi:hypothetical protein